MEPARHIIKSAEAKAESLGWVIAAVVMAITIVGLPWARAAFSIAAYTLLPFGYKAVPRDEYFGATNISAAKMSAPARWG